LQARTLKDGTGIKLSYLLTGEVMLVLFPVEAADMS
jgi:hypothetical protein